MGRIFCIVGKSASGKDTLYKKILSGRSESLIPVIPYTTRPMRTGEVNGKDYYFVTEDELRAYEKNGQVIEKRGYNTTQGMWYYFTLKFDIAENSDHILITTLEGAYNLTKYYGMETVHIVYLVIDDKIRLLRCIERESMQEKPDYSEVCRRFLADQKDFADENINVFKNIHRIDSSKDIESCLAEWDKIYNDLD